MKLSKEELKQKINELEISDEIKIELLEDVEDSMDIVEDNTAEVEELKAKYEELKDKYIARFMDSEATDVKEEKDEKFEEVEEKEEIDIEEI